MGNSSRINYKDYNNLLEFAQSLHAIFQQAGGQYDFRRRVVALLSQYWHFNHINFFLVDDSQRLKDVVSINVDHGLLSEYEKYYYKKDIFYTRMPEYINKKDVLSITDIMSYKEFEKTEYYNDFLKKGKLYHQVSLYLKSKDRLIGAIGILRPKENGDFSHREIIMLNNINRFVSQSLDAFLNYSITKQKKELLEECTNEMPAGLITLDSSLNVMFANEPAREMCSEIIGSSPTVSVRNLVDMIDSQHYIKSLTPGSCIYFIAQQYKIKVMTIEVHGTYNAVETSYMIYIAKEDRKNLNSYLKARNEFHLTNRELEVVDLILKGLSNKEIADKLFISNYTVKNHIENIFKKMDVTNRTSIISKLSNTEDSRSVKHFL